MVMESQPSNASVEDLNNDNNSIAKAVLQAITEDDFSNSAVDALLSMVHEGHVEVLGDVLAYLTSNGRPNWAAELCRMVIAGPDGKASEREYAPVAAALALMIANGPLEHALQTCHFVLEIKDNGYGNFFDCYDISFVLGHMVKAGAAAAAGQILYGLYCDDSDQGRMYQQLVPHVLGTLIDHQQRAWAVELGKQLMYEDGDRSIDYTALGWTMAQMVYCGRPDWAAALCDGMLAQRLHWYNQNAMLSAIANWGDYSYSQTVANFMTDAVPTTGGYGQYNANGRGGAGGGGGGRYGNNAGAGQRKNTWVRNANAANNGAGGGAAQQAPPPPPPPAASQSSSTQQQQQQRQRGPSANGPASSSPSPPPASPQPVPASSSDFSNVNASNNSSGGGSSSTTPKSPSPGAPSIKQSPPNKSPGGLTQALAGMKLSGDGTGMKSLVDAPVFVPGTAPAAAAARTEETAAEQSAPATAAAEAPTAADTAAPLDAAAAATKPAEAAQAAATDAAPVAASTDA